jgi:hypothetical protein
MDAADCIYLDALLQLVRAAPDTMITSELVVVSPRAWRTHVPAVGAQAFFFRIHRSHSISFTRAQGIPKYKIGFGREKDGRVCVGVSRVVVVGGGVGGGGGGGGGGGALPLPQHPCRRCRGAV